MNREKRPMQRLLAFALMLTMVFGILPPLEVFASAQLPAENVVIVGTSTTYGPTTATVGFNLTWRNKAYGVTTPTAQDENTANFVADGYDGFKIEAQNMTTNEAAWDLDTLPPLQYATTQSVNMMLGSIYRFRVKPFHYHIVTQTPRVLTEAYPAAANSNTDEALYLTDIQVEAKGSGKELNVIWDHPTFGGRPTFTRYRISYVYGSGDPRAIGKTITVGVGSGAGSASVAPPDPARPGVQRLQYTIEDAELAPGYYAVAVEPVVELGGERPLRGDNFSAPLTAITIDGKQYSIGYSEKGVMYGVEYATVTLPLNIEDYSATQLKLWWNAITGIGQVNKIEVFGSTSRSDLESILNSPGEISGALYTVYDNVKAVRIDRPKTGVWYYAIRIHVEGRGILPSEIVEYDASKLNIRPLRPDIHIPLSVVGNITGIEMYWDAFVREKFNDNDVLYEAINTNGRKYLVDTDVYYDIWVASNLNDLFNDALSPVITYTPGSLGNPVFHEQYDGGPSVPSFSAVLTQYYNNVNGYLQLSGIVSNKSYFIKIVARKATSISTEVNGGFLSSDPAYAEVYISPDGEISTPPMISAPPLRIRKYKGAEVITDTSIDVQWRTEWFEVYGRWTDEFGVTQYGWHTKAALYNNQLYFGKDAENYPDYLIDFYNLDTEEDVADALSFEISGVPQDFPTSRIRKQNLNGCGFEYKFMTQQDFFEAIDLAGSIENFMENAKSEDAGQGWVDFTPQAMDEDGSAVDPYVSVGGLSPNTPYAIFIRPYRIVSATGKKITYPNYIFGTTSIGQGDIDFDPTVPRFEAISSTDTTIDVRWTHTEPARYEIVYSTIPYSDIATDYVNCTMLSQEDLADAVSQLEGNQLWKYFTVTGLFPETTYYLWIRSIGTVNGEVKYSEWSNPTSMTTKEMPAPNPPDGLGLISQYHLSLYNQATGNSYVRSGEDYLIVEWTKDVNDNSPAATGGGNASADILGHPDFVSTYAVKFNGLIANFRYYVRAKTIVAASMAGPGEPTVKNYFYLVQISLNSDFTDALEVYVPVTPPAEGSQQYLIVKESVWSSTVILATGESDDEYDGDFDPNLVPLPEQDFEISYDSQTRTLTYRFRASGKDEDGNYDNRVDQRLISTLLRKGVFEYNVDVTQYENRIIDRRVVEIPYTVMEAFETEKISLGIRADNLTLTIPPGALGDTFVIKNTDDYGDASRIRIILTEDLTDLPRLQVVGTEYVQQYVSKPHQIAITLTTPSSTQTISSVGKPLDVKMKLDTRYDTLDKNVTMMQMDGNSGGWVNVARQYDRSGGRLSTEGQPGIYAVVATDPPRTIVQNPSDVSMYNVTSNISFTDMTGFYNSNADVTANQFINLVNALMTGQNYVNLNDTPSAQVISDMQKAGVAPAVTGGALVPREQAIRALIAVYEKKVYRINVNGTASSPYTDIQSAAADYQTALRKAGQIDFLGATTTARPKQNLKLGEMLQMVDVIMMDMGYN